MSEHDQSPACELCGKLIDSPVLTGDSHPEGPNYVVGECCVNGSDREADE